MRIGKYFLFVSFFIVSILSSCMTSYYQVYKTASNNLKKDIDNFLVFENEDCRIVYDLWSNGGNPGYLFNNKTNEVIHVRLNECFFVFNGIANDYFKNRVYTSSTSTSIVTGQGYGASISVTGFNSKDLVQTNLGNSLKSNSRNISTGHSISYNEIMDVIVPAHSSKRISEYNIVNTRFKDCDLQKYPLKKSQIKTLSFTSINSPLVFSNLITYCVGKSEKIERITNEFYIESITNYPEKEVVESRYDNDCGKISEFKSKYFKHVSPEMFYFIYD